MRFIAWVGLFVVFTAVFFVVGCAVQQPFSSVEQPLPEPLRGQEVQYLDDGTPYLVHPDNILSGGPPKGGIGVDRGIPALVDPEFVSVHDADAWLDDDELVLALQYGGQKRVYPFQILVFHEIVNDVVAGDPLLITYCPLCGTGIAYERTVGGVETNFGVSGKLYNSNLFMYDELTDTYWQQIEGNAILGERTGDRLTPISIDTVRWDVWRDAHPDSIVLSQNTGMRRPYGQDPYGGYYESDFLMFPVDHEDRRIHLKEVVYGIEVDGVYKAYVEQDIVSAGVIEDEVNGVPVRVAIDDVGVITMTNMDTGEEIVKERNFWFSWYAFHPYTQVYGWEE